MLAAMHDGQSAYAGERIRAARTLLGLSQGDLAEASGVGQTMISKIESGAKYPSDDLLDTIAAVTGTPRSFFDVVPLDIPPMTLRFRKSSQAKRGDTKRVDQLLAEAYRIVWTLVKQHDRYLAPTIPLATGEELSGEDIEELAARTREALGLDLHSPVRHVTRICERGGILVAPISLPGDGDESETVGHFGASCWPGPPEPALIGFFPDGPGDRQRFTLAHELGHLVLHTRRHYIPDPEGEANRFAGAFLVPAEPLREAMADQDFTLRDFAGLKARWGVSIQALIMRGSHLGLIDARRKESLFKQISARGWRKQEPVQVHHEEPALFWKLMATEFGTSRSVYNTAGDRLGLHSFLLGQLAPRATPRK
ncbi:helix-turn-helix domain protein [Parafrankia sp. EAN1pec]|uniref:XRE family transcriptional regulator n=1 Tax=Parafrankia sp. (strain EAN1pec) TaxID=298653 RepID=UPI00005422FE|nr:helix-turn-helix domain protein [Frankia sp. EAN1pec]